ncbi:MAG: hypothetical protein RIS70_3922, partial [Planctomycetota bacterium]
MTDADSILYLLTRLTEATGNPMDPLAARRALAEAMQASERSGSKDPIDFLMTVGEQVSVRVDSMRLSISSMLARARRHQAAATLIVQGESDGNEAWLLVSSAKGSKALVWTAAEGERWVSRSQLRDLCGGISEDQLQTWLTVQPGALFSHAPADESHGHDADGHGSGGPSLVKRLGQLLRPEASDIWVLVIFSAVVGVLSLATPVAVESLVNTVAFGRFIQPLFVICLILLVFLGFEGVLRMMQAYLAELIQQRLFVRVVADLAYRLPRVRQSAYDEHHGPEMMNRFFDVMTIQKSAALLVLDGIALVLQVSIGLVLLAFYHPLLLTLDLFLVAALGFMVVFLGHGAVATSIAESKAKYSVASWLEELARVPTLFRNADGPRRALIRADQLALGYVDARRRHFRVLLRQIAFALGLQAVSGSLLLGLGGWLVMQGQLTLGQLVAAELVLAVIVGSLTKLGKQLESFYDLLTAVDKVGHLFDLPMER